MKSVDFDLTDQEIEELKKYFKEYENGYWQPVCLYNGLNYKKCPNNENSFCKTKYEKFPKHLLHRWDGKNAIKCLCG